MILVLQHNLTEPVNLSPILVAFLHTRKENKQNKSKRIVLFAGKIGTRVAWYLLLLDEVC